MADIRINALANTASSTASDDFLPVDGTTNGTRKLSAYSPTFGGNFQVNGTGTIGGNLTVSGAGPHTFVGTVRSGSGSGETLTAGSVDVGKDIGIASGQGIVQGNARIVTLTSGNVSMTGNLTVSGSYLVDTNTSFTALTSTSAKIQAQTTWGGVLSGYGTTNDVSIFNKNGGLVLSIPTGTTNASIAGNLTVSGTGASSVAGNLGVGTTSPDIGSSGNKVLTIQGTFTRGRLQLSNTDGSSVGAIAGTVQFIQGTTELASIDALSVGATNSGQLNFYTTSAGTPAIRATLTSGGNLLLGTTVDAGGKLQIATGANSTLLIGNDATYSGYNQIALNGVRTNNATLGIIGGGTGDNGLYLLAPSGGQLLFQIAAATQFRVSSVGDATFAGTIDGMTKGSRDAINDDAVASFAPLTDRGFLIVNCPDANENALIAYFKSGASYLLYSITKSANVNLSNTTTPNGTTGTDGKITICYNSAGGVATLYIENRIGYQANFQRWAFAGST